MKRISPLQAQVGKPDILPDFDEEPGYYKDLFFPNDPTGNFNRTVRLRFLFQDAGCQVLRVERALQQPRVWIIRLRFQLNRIPHDNYLAKYVLQLLRSMDIRVRNADLLTQRTGNKILISFVMPPPAPDRKKEARLRRLLAELP